MMQAIQTVQHTTMWTLMGVLDTQEHDSHPQDRVVASPQMMVMVVTKVVVRWRDSTRSRSLVSSDYGGARWWDSRRARWKESKGARWRDSRRARWKESKGARWRDSRRARWRRVKEQGGRRVTEQGGGTVEELGGRRVKEQGGRRVKEQGGGALPGNTSKPQIMHPSLRHFTIADCACACCAFSSFSSITSFSSFLTLLSVSSSLPFSMVISVING